jgi:hypothetical protein
LYVSASNQIQIILRQNRRHKFLIRFEGETWRFGVYFICDDFERKLDSSSR